MRIRDWSSDVCSSDLPGYRPGRVRRPAQGRLKHGLGPVRCGRKNLLNEAVGVKPAGGDILIRMNCFVEDEGGQTDRRDRKSVVKGKRVSARGVTGGRRHININTTYN